MRISLAAVLEASLYLLLLVNFVCVESFLAPAKAQEALDEDYPYGDCGPCQECD